MDKALSWLAQKSSYSNLDRMELEFCESSVKRQKFFWHLSWRRVVASRDPEFSSRLWTTADDSMKYKMSS